MKELENKDKDVVVNVAEKPVEYTENYLHTAVLKRGQKMWMIHKDTLEIKEAQYKEQAIRFEDAVVGNVSSARKLIVEHGWFYIAAINKKNAYLKFLKHIGYGKD